MFARDGNMFESGRQVESVVGIKSGQEETLPVISTDGQGKVGMTRGWPMVMLARNSRRPRLVLKC